MGNWHCVLSSCATVEYREYLPPVVRWRYLGEQWQEIEGDNYTVDQVTSLTRDTYYNFVYREPSSQNSTNKDFIWDSDYTNFGSDRFNGIDSWRLKIKWANFNEFYAVDNKFSTYYFSQSDQRWYIYDSPYRQASFTVEVISQGVTSNIFLGIGTGIWGQKFVATDGLPDDQQCNFKVLKNNTIVYQKTTAVCPEVQKIPSVLSNEVKRIEIEKLPYLERIEVVPYQYSAYKSPGVPAPIVQADPIPPECLNIYQNAIYVIPPSGQGIYPNATPFDSFVGQICSVPGALPPQYQVLCDDCGCRDCPPSTCAVICDDHICCYNDYGVSIESIPVADYCGDVE